jgi:threonylcarbamoyladenosine tRNA methylthiotransferase MtaB
MAVCGNKGRMRVAFSTLGCRLNQAETDAMEAAVRLQGHEVSGPDTADVVVVNGCTITHEADADARKLVRRLHRRNASARIVVTGCYANAAAAQAAELPGVSLVLGNADKPDLPTWLTRLAPGPSSTSAEPPQVAISELVRGRSLVQLRAAPSSTRARALLKVQDGCNYRCAFCIVPQVRGPSCSVPVPELITRLRELVDAGVPEVVVTGVHLGTYGRDLRPRRTLTELVAELLPHVGPSRLRLSSIDPHEVDDELVGLLSHHPETLCRHMHLPVQSGDAEVLRRMRRGHTVEDFAALVHRLTDAVPGIAVGTDVIVGFPGEDDAAFARTHALLEALPLAYHHVFSYSIREGTAAAQMSGHLDACTKAKRSEGLRTLSSAQSLAFRRRFAGQVLDAVVHLRPRSGATRPDVLTDNYLRLPWHGSPSRAGRRVRVRVDDEASVAHPCEDIEA